jgi:hypothetical protein
MIKKTKKNKNKYIGGSLFKKTKPSSPSSVPHVKLLPLDPTTRTPNIKWYNPTASKKTILPTVANTKPILPTVANTKPIPPTVANSKPILPTVANSKPILHTVANSKPMDLLKYANQTHQIKRARNNIQKIEANIVKTRFYEILKRNRLKKQLSNQTQKMTNYQYQLAKNQAMIEELQN